jgi:hypothetical protein
MMQLLGKILLIPMSHSDAWCSILDALHLRTSPNVIEYRESSSTINQPPETSDRIAQNFPKNCQILTVLGEMQGTKNQ